MDLIANRTSQLEFGNESPIPHGCQGCTDVPTAEAIRQSMRGKGASGSASVCWHRATILHEDR